MHINRTQSPYGVDPFKPAPRPYNPPPIIPSPNPFDDLDTYRPGREAKIRELMRLSDVGRKRATLLVEAGVDSLRDLARRNEYKLADRLNDVNWRRWITDETYTARQVRAWIEEAQWLAQGGPYGVDPFKPIPLFPDEPYGIDPFKPKPYSPDSPYGTDPFKPNSPYGVDPFKR